ncbi:succinyl-CoA synthetase alpha subunit [Desulfobaculum xiamenense]|uniref:Succinate--CoA ligase [ADP-forming] subunit alpha n=1 Tax=Desulfobaculum xiamenense TaxID=995050 RepID=A0A846QVY0_9BACT|nr:succinate--CoA ligase subunit alpha [Desulfobaculum xiamenense]NJB68789.1 succinyl-CoA synthetase alpha subunit [Desulfobaculum xiamenense]
MLLNEHQSKRLFAEAGVAVPEGVPVSATNLESVKPKWPLPWFLKAQVLAGGRGKAGGILRIDDPDDLVPYARKLFAMTIRGRSVPLLRLERSKAYEREFYCSFAVSRELGCLAFSVGRKGGIDVESQSQDLHNILVQRVSMTSGLENYHIRAAFFHLDVDKEHWPTFSEFVRRMHRAVIDYGLLLAEINPLVLDADGVWTALDGKVEMDDNVLLQHSDFERFYTPEHASREENRAREVGLSYHSLGGRIGLMVNGAGLAMATMDLLNLSGLAAANFMDLGGAADLDRTRTAMSLLFEDESVTSVFINIFGGVLSCEKVALALAEALDGREPRKPLVVRLSGNQSPRGREILEALGCRNMFIVSEMHDAIAQLKRNEGMRLGETPELAVQHEIVPSVPAAFPRSLPFEKGLPVLVQGITGRTAQFHTRLMLDYGTNIVAGVTPFKGGQYAQGIPVYNSITEALELNSIRASIIFVPAAFAPDAILEAAQNGIEWVICITDGLKQQDMLRVREQLRGSGTRLVGPNCPGLIAPGRTKIGIMPDHVFMPGPVAILSRSGTLTYEAATRLTRVGIGQSLCVGIGGDPFIGTSFSDMLGPLEEDENTKALVILGEIGGTAEEELAEHVRRTGFSKPIVAFVAGQTAPPGKRLGHAGAILESGRGVEDKLMAMAKAGFAICPDLSSLPRLVAHALSRCEVPVSA